LNAENKTVFTEKQIRGWGEKVLDECNLPKKYQETELDVLITTNLRGVDTHGINLIMMHAQKNKDVPPTPIRVLQNKGACVLIDGGSNMGSIASIHAMERTVEKASEHGIGITLVKNSNHFGAAGHYPLYAAQRGYIGFASTTALVNLAPWGSLTEIVGKNPFAVSLPWNKFPIVLDVSCSVAARQKVVAAAREGRLIPEGWALDPAGNPTTDPKAALEGIFLPMGEYKGVGMAIMIDFMIAALCQEGWSHTITQKNIGSGPEPSHVGHIFIAIDPEFFLAREALNKQIEEFIRRFYSCKLIPGFSNIYLPGEKEWNTYQERKANGIPLAGALVAELNAYAEKHGLPRMGDV